MKKKSQTIICYSIEILVLAIFIFSYIYLFLNSIKSNGQYYEDPWGFADEAHWENYTNFLTNFGAAKYWFNTIIYSAIAILLSLPISMLCAFALRLDSRKNLTKTFLFLIVGLHFFPEVITIEPFYRILSLIGAIRNHFAIIIMHIKALLPINIIFLYTTFRKVSDEIIDNYILDGLNWFRIFMIELPKICKSEIVAMISLNLFVLFKDYTVAYIFINEDSFSTINVAISRYLSTANFNYPQYFAAIIMTEMPFYLIIIFAFVRNKPLDLNIY